MKPVAGGRFEASDYSASSHMQQGGTSLVFDDSLAASEVVALVREKQKEIADGLFRVDVNDAEPKAA